MAKTIIKEAIKLFRTKKIRIKMNRDYENNPMIVHLPDGCGSILDDLEFLKIKIDYKRIEDQIVFSVCVDDFLWINKNYKLVDKEEEKTYFGQNAKLKNGKVKEYSSIDARAVAVITAIIEGKIEVDETCK